ncbi:MAG: hypothetical protein JW939_00325 [Candidatus Thermoplasmatota archaeon]|nr:hypothetical protein [Candidatus Thermoplasmatota archaeon]
MARRRIIHEEKAEEEKEKRPAFQPSEFNETEFLQTENKSAKMIYISLSVAVVAGILSFGLMRLFYYLDTGLHFIVPIVSPVAFAVLVLYLFHRFGIDIRELEWKKWLENGFMYLLAWFVVWMLSMNPPISDFSDPQIQEPVLELKTDGGRNFTYFQEWLYINELVTDSYTPSVDIEDVSQIMVYAVITDNGRFSSEIEVQYLSEGSYVLLEEEELASLGIQIRKDIGFEPDEDLEDKIDDTWLQTDPKAWDGYLWTVVLEMKEVKNSTLLMDSVDQDSVLDMKVVYRAWDRWDNEARKEFTFRIGL